VSVSPQSKPRKQSTEQDLGPQKNWVLPDGRKYEGTVDHRGRPHGRGKMVWPASVCEAEMVPILAVRQSGASGASRDSAASAARSDKSSAAHSDKSTSNRLRVGVPHSTPRNSKQRANSTFSETSENQALAHQASSSAPLPNQGRYYDGVFEHGRREGLGRELTPDGDAYEGQFHNDRWHGTGTYTWAIKEGEERPDVYHGEWVNGVQHGAGHKQFGKDGALYRGPWKFGKMTGADAHWVYGDGAVYKGHMLNNCRDGKFGEFWDSDGSYYRGSWRKDMCHGRGEMWEVVTTEVFETSGLASSSSWTSCFCSGAALAVGGGATPSDVALSAAASSASARLSSLSPPPKVRVVRTRSQKAHAQNAESQTLSPLRLSGGGFPNLPFRTSTASDVSMSSLGLGAAMGAAGPMGGVADDALVVV